MKSQIPNPKSQTNFKSDTKNHKRGQPDLAALGLYDWILGNCLEFGAWKLEFPFPGAVIATG